MTDKLIEFLTKLSADDDLVRSFQADKDGTMKANGVSDDHRKLVIDKKYPEIQSLLGADYNIAKNDIIKAFKK